MKFGERNGLKLIVRFALISLPMVALFIVCGINFLPIEFTGIQLDGKPWAGLDGDTVYLTLMNLVIAVYTLAVTAFIFLATALMERREKYEQETIRIMLKESTFYLMVLSVISVIGIIGCLIVERTDNCASLIKKGISILSIIDLGFLLFYSVSIINYENRLVSTAKRERWKLEQWAITQGNKDTQVTFQMIGDLSMIVDRLLENHAREYHYIENQHVLKQLAGKNFAETYSKIVSYRDFLRIENRSSSTPWECAPQLWNVLQDLQDLLKANLLQGENLTDMSFIGKSFFKTKKAFILNDAVMSDSLFVEVDLSNADLKRVDMSRTRLHKVNLSDANCEDSVFTESVWNGVKISEKSSFQNAVFRDVDFNGQKFLGKANDQYVKLIKLMNTSFVHSNMLSCELKYADLSHSNLKNALLSGAKIDSTALSYADLSGAIMVGISMNHSDINNDVFPLSQFLKENQKNGDIACFGFELTLQDGTPLSPAFYANLENATLAESEIKRINWNGSRIANCNFTYAVVQQCKFVSSYGQNVTFRDAVISDCFFQYATLNSADFSYTQIDKCDFTDANLQNSLFVHMSPGNELGNICDTIFLRTNFSGAQFQGCKFYKCNFTDANFANTTLNNVEFVDCVFSEETNFSDSYQIGVKGLPSQKKKSAFIWRK